MQKMTPTQAQDVQGGFIGLIVPAAIAFAAGYGVGTAFMHAIR